MHAKYICCSLNLQQDFYSSNITNSRGKRLFHIAWGELCCPSGEAIANCESLTFSSVSRWNCIGIHRGSRQGLKKDGSFTHWCCKPSWKCALPSSETLEKSARTTENSIYIEYIRQRITQGYLDAKHPFTFISVTGKSRVCCSSSSCRYGGIFYEERLWNQFCCISITSFSSQDLRVGYCFYS